MVLFQRLLKFYKENLKYPNTENFDEEFQELLQIFFFFGYYQPKHTKKRIIYGVTTFIVIVMTFVVGCFKDATIRLREHHMSTAMMATVLGFFALSLPIQILSVALNHENIMKMIKGFHTMHEFGEEEQMKEFKQRCRKILRFYRGLTSFDSISLSILSFFKFGIVILAMPVAYDVLVTERLFYIFVLVSSVHLYLLSFIFVASDLLHIFCMVRAQANMSILSRKLRNCADSNDSYENETNLIACIKHHIAIIE